MYVNINILNNYFFYLFLCVTTKTYFLREHFAAPCVSTNFAPVYYIRFLEISVIF